MPSTNLVILFCVSAGKNGEELGSDEEQIVFFVFLVYDVTNNKKVALQSYYCKPQPSELSETVLTDDCKTETGLEENAVKNGQPLDHVLDEFDRFLKTKGLHPDHGGKSFCFITDGQNHLRQCLHPEASNKNIGLPSYFCHFYDIRKEFMKHYGNDTNRDIKAMLDYLGLLEDCSVEYGVRQANEMAAIICRLINDGHVFKDPEVINERLEQGLCSKAEYVDENTVVRARGLPWQSSDQDIARFFKGLNIAKGGVALCLSPQGRRNGEALIRLVSEEHRDLALKRHKHHIGQRYIEVYRATGKDFINVAGGSNTEAQAFLSRGGEVIIRMRGLPFTATPQQVLEFFTRDPTPCSVLDGEDGILFVHYPDGRSTGDAFVMFATDEEANKALQKHRESMGSRYIELFKSTTAEVQQVLNRSMDPRNPEQPDSALPQMLTQVPIPMIPQNLITSGNRRDCIRLRNLPSGAQVTDILTFLGEYSQCIVYQGVHMVFTATGEPSGEAFIQMDSEENAQYTAIAKNRRPMSFNGKKRIIDVLSCSGDDMSVVLNGVGLPMASLPPAHTPIIQRSVLAPTAMTTPAPAIIPTSVAQFSSLPFPHHPIAAAAAAHASVGSHLPQHIQAATAAAYPHTISPAISQRPSYFPPVLYW